MPLLRRSGQFDLFVSATYVLFLGVIGGLMLVESLNHEKMSGETESTVLGPFYIPNAPEYDYGANICLDGKGEPVWVFGKVIDNKGRPIPGAKLEVWQANEDGFYDVQQPGIQPRWNNRGRFVTGPDGKYRFVGIKPVSYPIPDDGPVGRMLGQLGRHPYRPAHMHYLVTAPGFKKIVTHTFVGGDPYLESDTVFGVKQTLVAPFERAHGATEWRSPFDFVMVPETALT